MPKKIAIVGGCGHVGLPLAIALASHFEVQIYDIDEEAGARVRKGEMPFRDEGAEEALKEALQRGRIQIDSKPNKLVDCDHIVVVVGTPVDRHLNPSFTAIDELMGQLNEVLRDGQTLVLRSTLYPGTSQRVHRDLARRGRRIEVIFCPERVAQGQALREIRTLPQIISAFSAKGFQAGRELFSPLGVELVELSPLEAELTKLFSNVYRYISFAVANQFFMLASEAGADFYKILHAMKHNYPRGANMPPPGLTAGPCLFKDTMQMSAFNNNNFFLGHSAMLVNEGLPQFIANRMRTRWPDLGKKTVGLLGMAFKAESDDSRESLSYKLRKILSLNAKEVLACDPYVNDPSLSPENEVLAKADLFLIGAPHKRYQSLDYREKPVVDIWNHLGRGAMI